MTPIIKGKADRERVRKAIKNRISQLTRHAHNEGIEWVTAYCEQRQQELFAVQSILCGPSPEPKPKARKK